MPNFSVGCSSVKEGRETEAKVIRAYIESRLKGSVYVSLFVKNIKREASLSFFA